MPLADTIKRSGDRIPSHTGVDCGAGTPVIAETVDREGLWAAQTPQMFRALELTQALEQAQQDGAPITDEASAMEKMGGRPLLVQGSPRNFKITWPEDFELMEKWL